MDQRLLPKRAAKFATRANCETRYIYHELFNELTKLRNAGSMEWQNIKQKIFKRAFHGAKYRNLKISSSVHGLHGVSKTDCCRLKFLSISQIPCISRLLSCQVHYQISLFRWNGKFSFSGTNHDTICFLRINKAEVKQVAVNQFPPMIFG